MAIKKGDKANFNTMLKAAANGDLVLVQCEDAKTGQYVAVICMMSSDDGGIVATPVAKMFTGNPYTELKDPMSLTPKETANA